MCINSDVYEGYRTPRAGDGWVSIQTGKKVTGRAGDGWASIQTGKKVTGRQGRVTDGYQSQGRVTDGYLTSRRRARQVSAQIPRRVSDEQTKSRSRASKKSESAAKQGRFHRKSHTAVSRRG